MRKTSVTEQDFLGFQTLKSYIYFANKFEDESPK